MIDVLDRRIRRTPGKRSGCAHHGIRRIRHSRSHKGRVHRHGLFLALRKQHGILEAILENDVAGQVDVAFQQAMDHVGGIERTDFAENAGRGIHLEQSCCRAAEITAHEAQPIGVARGNTGVDLAAVGLPASHRRDRAVVGQIAEELRACIVVDRGERAGAGADQHIRHLGQYRVHQQGAAAGVDHDQAWRRITGRREQAGDKGDA